MIDQKDIETIREALEYDKSIGIDTDNALAALSRIEAEAKEVRKLCLDCQDVECLGSPHPERCDFATVKDNLTVQDARDLAQKVAKSVSDSMHTPIVLDIYGEAIDFIEAHDVAVREDERTRGRDALVDLKYYINNPSAWTHFDQSVSDAILRAVATIDPAARSALDGKEDGE